MFFGCDSCFTRWSSQRNRLHEVFKERGSLFRLSRSYRRSVRPESLAGVNRGPGTTGIYPAWWTFARSVGPEILAAAGKAFHPLPLKWRGFHGLKPKVVIPCRAGGAVQVPSG